MLKFLNACQGGHRHVHLISGRAHAAQVYPRQFCTTLCAGIAAQKKLDDLGVVARPVMSMEEMLSVAKVSDGREPSEALHEECGDNLEAYDDLSGDRLVPSLMQKARREEIEYFKQMGVYDKVAIQEAYDVTGKAPIAVRWVDVNKGDSQSPKYRSRLVAKEFNTGVNPDLYAATPPSECLRLMLSMLASGRSRGITLMYADVSRAYFYAKAERPVYVKLPAEDSQPGDEGKCRRLRMSMYGTRDAALNWSKEYADTLKSAGFVQGRSNPCLFRNHKLDVSIMVHGDDFIAVGTEANLKETRAALENKYKIKVEVLGDKKDQTGELRILNKVVRLTDVGVELEADPRHVELTVRDLGLEQAKASSVPGAKESKPRGSKSESADSVDAYPHVRSAMSISQSGGGEPSSGRSKINPVDTVEDNGRRGEWQDGELWSEEVTEDHVEDDDLLLPKSEATLYRAVAARLNYLAPDRPDIAFSVKEAARAMSAPRQSHLLKIKKLGKYLKGRPRLVSLFKWQSLPEIVTTFTDSDWAGCQKTARSTSGGVVCLGDHTVKTYSKQQKVVALSSAEAELYAMVLASAETIAMQAYAADLGMQLGGELYADSSAALGIAKRAGIGKVRHLRTQSLWIQEVRVSGRIVYKKVLGEKNPADLLTKYMTADLSLRHLTTIAARFAEGRAESAPEIDTVEDATGARAIDGGSGGSSDVTSWVRRIVDQNVRFCESVSVRPIPAEGLGRKCQRSNRKRMQGRWQRGEPQPASQASLELAIKSSAAEGVDSVVTEGEMIEVMVSREKGCATARSESHEIRRAEGARHVCGIGKWSSWKDSSSDSDEEVDCEACRDACAQLELPMRPPGRWRAEEFKEVCLLELGRSQSDLGKWAKASQVKEEDEYVREERGSVELGFCSELFLEPVPDGQILSDSCRVSLMPKGIELLKAAPLGDFYRQFGVVRALIERASVRPDITPASSGCVPIERCTSFGNSCCIASCSLSVGLSYGSGHFDKGGAPEHLYSLHTCTCKCIHVYNCFIERCVRECIAMLPLTYADVQADEPRLVNRNRGSSPL